MITTLDNQLAFFEDLDDSAILFCAEENRKRYTARQVEQMESKRNAILMLLGSDWPVEVIARQLHVNVRTVTALAKRSGEEVAGFKREFAHLLMRTGGRWIGLARAKEDQATFKDLTIGAGIVMQHARELHMMGEVGEEKIVKEEQDHAQAAAALRALMAGAGEAALDGQPASEASREPDFNSGEKHCSDNGLGDVGAGGGAESDQEGATEGERASEGAGAAGTGGGDQAGHDHGSEPIHLREGGLSGKGPDE